MIEHLLVYFTRQAKTKYDKMFKPRSIRNLSNVVGGFEQTWVIDFSDSRQSHRNLLTTQADDTYINNKISFPECFLRKKAYYYNKEKIQLHRINIHKVWNYVR